MDNRNRDSKGRYAQEPKPEQRHQNPSNWEDLNQEQRQSFNDGVAHQQDAQEMQVQQEYEAQNNDSLQQAMLQAVSLVGEQIMAKPLFDLSLDVQRNRGNLEMSHFVDGEQVPLYHMPEQTLTTLQQAQAADDLCQNLDKMGDAGREAAKAVRTSILQSSNNVTF